jgi:hypothetical protein
VWFAGHTRGPLPPSSFPGRKTDLRPAKHANHAKRAPPQRKQQENRTSFFGQLVRRGLFRVSSCGSRAILGVPFPQAVSPDGKPTFGPLNTLTTRSGSAAAEAAREQNFFLRSARPARAFSRQFVWFAGHTRGPLPPSSFPGPKTDLRPAKHANHAKRAPPQRKQQENRTSFFGQLVRRGLFRVSSCGSRAILAVPFP